METKLKDKSTRINDLEIDDVWAACQRIQAKMGHLLNKSTEHNNAFQEGFEACFKWLKNRENNNNQP